VFSFATEFERDKFEYIFNKYKNLMLHKAYGILRDYSLAEDAASEAFIRIYRNLGKIGSPDDARTAAFVVTIVKNVSLTMLQREKGRATEEYDEEAESGFDLEESALSRLESGHVIETLDKLGEEFKAVFLLKYAYDFSHREIGNMLGISENNVTVRLHRAKKRLAAILREEGFADA
jgi:RNA polymerase sigma-70 factor (ECF subfamily)